MDGRGRARRRLPEEAVEKQNTPSSCMCVTAFPEMRRQPTGSTVIRQKQTHAEPITFNSITIEIYLRKTTVNIQAYFRASHINWFSCSVHKINVRFRSNCYLIAFERKSSVVKCSHYFLSCYLSLFVKSLSLLL